MKKSWSVTVVYDDAARRAEAMELCDQFVERFWAGGELDLSWWSFEQLQEPESLEQAASKATQADVIVFATRAESGVLPMEVSAWIERWLASRGDREGMLVGLLGAGERAAERHLHLRKVAHRGGMDYLTGLPECATPLIPDSFESYDQRAQHISSVLDGILHNPPPPPHLVS